MRTTTGIVFCKKFEDRARIREHGVYVRAKHANSFQIVFATNETVATVLTLQPTREQQFERFGAWCLQFSDHANNVRFKHFYGRRKRANMKVEDRTIIREPRVYVRAKHANSLQIGKGRNRRACSTGTHLWVIFATNETVATSAHGF